MKKDRFYSNTGGTNDNIYKSAISFSLDYAREVNQIKKIALLVNTQKNTGWFERLFGKEGVKDLFHGTKVDEEAPILKLETKKSFREGDYASEIVITCGLDSKDIFEIDDYISIKAMIAIPWSEIGINEWVERWNPLEFRSKKPKLVMEEIAKPNCIIMEALTDLSTINMSDRIISHPLDKARLKTVVRVLYKYEPSLDVNLISFYIVNDLGWPTGIADEIAKLINILKSGGSFRGGETTGLQNYYKRWKDNCKAK